MVIFARIPVSGFAYKTGVKNIRNVIKREITFPVSLITPFKIEKIKPNPRVNKRIGRMTMGSNRMPMLGVT